MVTAVNLVNQVLTPLFDLVCWPFQALAPIWAMTVISLVSGVAMVWIFGKVSDQSAIRAVRDQIRGNLIGVRLFQSDLGVVMRLQRRIFGDTMRYMRYALVPMIVLLVPVLLIMTQLNLRFASGPVPPGEAVMVKAFVRDASVLDQVVTLEIPDGVAVETPGVRVPSTREVAWRVRPLAPGEHQMTVSVGGETLDSHLVSGDRWGPIPQRRTGRGAIDTLLYPGEPPIPPTHSIEAVEISYPVLDLTVFGWNVHWLLAFFVLSIAFGFAFKDALGVEV